MVKPIKLSNFNGMNNVKDAEGLFIMQDDRATGTEPRIVLNADILKGRITKREGYELYASLTSPHSLGSHFGLMFCVSQGKLKKVENGTATDICDVSVPDSPVAHVAADEKVYLSNSYWNGVLDTEAGAVSSWGITVPAQPVLLPSTGHLPAGKYDVCFTAVVDGEVSGSGPIATIEFDDDDSGITILNRPADCIVWMTDPNGGTFYLCGEVDTIDTPPQRLEPLLSLFCFPPPYMDVLCLAFGRIWGARGNTVYYSESGHYGWWKVYTAKFHHDHPVTMIAATATGLYVGTEAETIFYSGTEPTEMQPRKRGPGVVKGSLTYCNRMGEFGNNAPCWLSPTGIFVGTQDGQPTNLTGRRIKFAPGPEAATHYRVKDGHPQIMTAFRGDSNAGASDDATCEVVRNGKVI